MAPRTCESRGFTTPKPTVGRNPWPRIHTRALGHPVNPPLFDWPTLPCSGFVGRRTRRSPASSPVQGHASQWYRVWHSLKWAPSALHPIRGSSRFPRLLLRVGLRDENMVRGNAKRRERGTMGIYHVPGPASRCLSLSSTTFLAR